MSDIGGFAEIIQHGKNGLTTYVGNSQSLADNIVAILEAPALAQKLRDQAYEDVITKYQWSQIAVQTEEVFRRILGQSESLDGRDLNSRMTNLIRYDRYQQTGDYLDQIIVESRHGIPRRNEE